MTQPQMPHSESQDFDQKRNILNAARFATLDRTAETQAAKSLVEELENLTLAHEAQHHPRKRIRRENDAKSFRGAITALAADLVSHSANEKAERYMFRPMDRGELAETLVSSDAFEKLRLYWGEIGWMEETTFAHFNSVFVSGDNTQTYRKARRYRATPAFLDLAQGYQITSLTISEHFQRGHSDGKLVQVREAKGGSHRHPMGGRLLKTSGPVFERVCSEVEELNRSLADFDFSLRDTPRLRRVFNNGDASNFQFNFGGRFYCASDDDWMQMSKRERGNILIDGERVVEIDITASHLSILYSKCDQVLKFKTDPYADRRIPREVIKACVVAYIGKGGRPHRWPSLFNSKFVKKHGYHPRERYRLKDVIDRLEWRHPVLKQLEAGKLDWAVLQYEEAECFREAMEKILFINWSPCLPVHDSLIVCHKDREWTASVLEDAYESRLGFRPSLKIIDLPAKP